MQYRVRKRLAGAQVFSFQFTETQRSLGLIPDPKGKGVSKQLFVKFEDYIFLKRQLDELQRK